MSAQERLLERIASLERENAQKDRENASLKRKFEEENTEKDQIISTLKGQISSLEYGLMLAKFQSTSYAQIKEDFWAKSEEIPETDIVPGVSITDDVLKTAWDFMQKIPAPDFVKEDSTQIFFNKAIPILLKHLGRDRVFSFFPRKMLRDPKLAPDGILAPFGLTPTSWVDMVMPLEFKVPQNRTEGLGQGISYMSHMLDKQSFLKRTRGACIYTDWQVILVCQIEEVGSNTRTQLLNLFGEPGKWKPNPTDGFKLLCRLLSSSVKDHGYIPIPSFVKVGSESWKVQRMLGQGANGIAYACQPPDSQESVVVKVPNHQSPVNSFVLKAEGMHMKTIRGLLSPNNAYILPEVVRFPDNALVTRPIGVSLCDYLPDESKTSEVMRWGIKWLESLRILHQAGYVHNDARPQNAVVVSDRVMLIDFQNPCRKDHSVTIFRFSVPQMPSRWLPVLISQQMPDLWSSSVWDDIEQFVYGMSYLLHQCQYLWMKGVTKDLLSQITNTGYQDVINRRSDYFRRLKTRLPEKCLYEWLQENRNDFHDPNYASLINLMQDFLN